MRVVACLFAIAVASAAPNDYSNPKSWLCLPGQPGLCDVNLATTAIAADGKFTREEWKADANAPVDCFYVYPTVSTDTGMYSDMEPDPAERIVIKQQLARFGSKCKLYAPMYRQVTLAGLRQLLTQPTLRLDAGMQYDDVRDAWNYYLEHFNRGRGVVLLGHSQGSFILAELLRQEIDGKPVQSKLVSAILPGASIAVAKGKTVGGKLQKIPVCTSATQTACLVAYSAFRATAPPPDNTRFGKIVVEGQEAACVNPAALGGGSGELHAYLSKSGETIVRSYPVKPWVTPERSFDTDWVSMPGFFTAKCTRNENAVYLEVTLHSDPTSPRVSEITGDLTPDWGLHLLDVDLALGNLVDLVGTQSKAWLAANR